MHSTIYELSERPISERRRATIDSLPEWFFQTVADSAADTDDITRAVQIRCLEQHFGDLCIRDGDQLRFVCDFKARYFRKSYPYFMAAVRALAKASYDIAALCLPQLSMRRSEASRKAMQTASASTSMTLTTPSCFLWMPGCGRRICQNHILWAV